MFQGMDYVYEVYKEQSFSKAAANLFISQPSLSANVKRIEKRIGYPVFDRSTKPLQLTECGRQYIRSVEKILSIQHQFADFVNDLGELKTGKLTVGGSSFFSSWVLPPLIGTFARKYPLVDILLVEENTAKLAALLQRGQLDLMVDNCELDEHIFERCVYQKEHLLLAVPKSFAVNEKLMEYRISAEQIRDGSYLQNRVPPVPLDVFTEEPFVLLKPENDTGKRAMSICQKNEFHPKVALELDQQLTAYNVTCSGMGISFIGDMLISRGTQISDVVYYKLPGDESERNIYFYWKKGRYMSRTMEEFLKQVGLQRET